MQKRYYARKRRNRRKAKTRFYVLIGVLVAALAVGIFFIVKAVSDKPGTAESPSDLVVMGSPDPDAVDMGVVENAPEQDPTPTPISSLPVELVPHAIEGETDPATFGFDTDLMVDGVEQDTYQRDETINVWQRRRIHRAGGRHLVPGQQLPRCGELGHGGHHGRDADTC